MKFTNVRELKMRTAEILEAIDEGEEFVITYKGKPRAVLLGVGEDDFRLKDREGMLPEDHPFFDLMGKGEDTARDVSSNKYKFLGIAAKRRR